MQRDCLIGRLATKSRTAGDEVSKKVRRVKHKITKLIYLQIYEESGFFDNTLDSSSRYIPNDDVVNVVTYNANTSFSLVR